MKKLLALAVMMAMALGLVLAACGSSGGGSSSDCAAICAKIGDCGEPSDEQECLDDCPGMANIIRASAWSRATSCILDTPCGPDFDPEACLVQSGVQEPDSVIQPLANTLCTKAQECDDTVVIDTCVNEFMSDGDTALFKIFTDATLTCLGDCVSGKTCSELNNDIESAIPACACGCGIGIYCY